MSNKCSIIAMGSCLLAGYATVGGLYGARWANVVKIQSAYEENYLFEFWRSMIYRKAIF